MVNFVGSLLFGSYNTTSSFNHINVYAEGIRLIPEPSELTSVFLEDAGDVSVQLTAEREKYTWFTKNKRTDVMISAAMRESSGSRVYQYRIGLLFNPGED